MGVGVDVLVLWTPAGAHSPQSTQAFAKFMKQWETDKVDGIVTLDEFIEYYRDVSPSIDRDDYFELMMRNAWHLPGGVGAAANTTCRRVMVVQRDGTQSVQVCLCVIYAMGSKE